MLRRIVTALCATGLLAGSAAAMAPASFAAPHTGSLSVTITGLPRHPALVLGGPAATFVVTVHNGTGQVQHDITPVVALDHCTCSASPVEPAPAGTLQERDHWTWRTVPYDIEGTGMDYLDIVQQPTFTLRPGASASFTFRLAFKAQHEARQGQSGILVSVVRVPVNLSRGNPVLASDDVPVTVIR
jgi:hypothetical protein